MARAPHKFRDLGKVLFVPGGNSPSRVPTVKPKPCTKASGTDCGACKQRDGELAESDERPRGTADGAGVQNSIQRVTPPRHTHVPTEIFGRGAEVAAGGGAQVDSEGGHCASGRSARAVSGSPVPSPEEGWVAEAHLQSEETKQIDCVPALQDGGASDAEGLVDKGGLDGQAGSEGCIFLRSDAQRGQEIPQIQVEQADIRVSMPAVRFGIGPQTVHKAVEASSCILEEAGHKNDLLPRRHVDREPEQTTIVERWHDGSHVAGRPGVCCEQAEVGHSAHSVHRVFGRDAQLCGDEAQSARRQVGEHTEEVFRSLAARAGNSPSTGKADWDFVLVGDCSVPSTAPLQAASDAAGESADNWEVIRDNRPPDSTSEGRGPLVDGQLASDERQGNLVTGPRLDHRVGRVSYGLGGDMQWPEGQWSLDHVGTTGAHQCVRVKSCVSGSADIFAEQGGSPCPHQSRQYHDCDSHQQDGGHKVGPIGDTNQRALGVLLGEAIDSVGRVSAGGAEYGGRPPVEVKARCQRLAAGSSGVRSLEQIVGSLQRRLVCEQVKCTTDKVFQLEERCRGDWEQCAPHSLERGEGVCVSTLLSGGQMSGEGAGRSSQSYTGGSGVASSAMVCGVAASVAGPANTVATVARVVDLPSRRCAPVDREQLFVVGGMEDYRGQTGASGLSEDAAALLTYSRRKGTREAYRCSWQKWVGWCRERAHDPVRSPVEVVVEFIADMWKAGYEYSTINGFRSAISAYHEQVESAPVGQHHLVRRALTGVFNVNPPRPKYQDTWDVNVVLLHLQGLGPDVDLSDLQLTRKLAMLLALTTASRASEVQGLNIEYMSDKGDQIDFTIPKLTKTRRPGMKPVSIMLRSYPEHEALDVVHCVRVYLRRTVEWRTTRDQHELLLVSVDPHKPVVTSFGKAVDVCCWD